MIRYVISHDGQEFDSFSHQAQPIFVGKDAGRTFRFRTVARIHKALLPHTLRGECVVRKVVIR